MINFKKMDDEDFVFISKPIDKKEEKEFRDFLKKRKTTQRRPNIRKRNKSEKTV